MKVFFSTIKEFFDIKEKCIFCEKDLRPLLKNYVSGPENKLPTIRSQCIDDCFTFNIDYCSQYSSIKAIGTINIINNVTNFSNVVFESNYGYGEYDAIRFAFFSLSPHVELSCINKKCKMNYYISSTSFGCINNIDFIEQYSSYKIAPISIAQESFNLDKFLVMNPPGSNTYIYNSKNINSPPLMIQKIDFDSIEKEKLFSKIRTSVSFS